MGREMQGVVAHLNALLEDNQSYLTMMKSYLRRREIDMLYMFFLEHKEIPIPEDLKEALDSLPGGKERQKELADMLRARRAPQSAGSASSPIILD